MLKQFIRHLVPNVSISNAVPTYSERVDGAVDWAKVLSATPDQWTLYKHMPHGER